MGAPLVLGRGPLGSAAVRDRFGGDHVVRGNAGTA